MRPRPQRTFGLSAWVCAGSPSPASRVSTREEQHRGDLLAMAWEDRDRDDASGPDTGIP